MKEKNFISAVIYVHNCEERIGDFCRMVYRQLQEHFAKFEIICVNDASTDGSRAEIKKTAQEFADTTVTILDMSYYQGQEASMNAGVDLAIGDFVYEFDSTCQDYEESLIFEIYQKSLTGYDIVSAAVDKKEKWSSHLFYKVFGHFSTYKYQLQTESFRILSRRAITGKRYMPTAVWTAAA